MKRPPRQRSRWRASSGFGGAMSSHGHRPSVTVEFEPRFCANHVADLTAGCSFGCIYCPFSQLGARRHGVSRPTALDLSALHSLPAPPSLFLRSEEHTSELQSRVDLVCRLLLEKTNT